MLHMRKTVCIQEIEGPVVFIFRDTISAASDRRPFLHNVSTVTSCSFIVLILIFEGNNNMWCLHERWALKTV